MLTMKPYSEMVAGLFKCNQFNKDAEALIHSAVGISGEAGELLDAVKKVWAYGKLIDRQNIIEELGDLEFYMEALRQQLVISREETLIANQEKLAKRYSDGVYSNLHAQARMDKVEEPK